MAGKGKLPVVIEFLIAQDQHCITVDRVPDRADLGWRKRAASINA
jgi:hypothetical protein